jgi:hypothetical protein
MLLVLFAIERLETRSAECLSQLLLPFWILIHDKSTRLIIFVNFDLVTKSKASQCRYRYEVGHSECDHGSGALATPVDGGCVMCSHLQPRHGGRKFKPYLGIMGPSQMKKTELNNSAEIPNITGGDGRELWETLLLIRWSFAALALSCIRALGNKPI